MSTRAYLIPAPFQASNLRIRGLAIAETVTTGTVLRPTGMPDVLVTAFHDDVSAVRGGQHQPDGCQRCCQRVGLVGPQQDKKFTDEIRQAGQPE